MKNKDLDWWRARINETDEKLLILMVQRKELALEVAKTKIRTGSNVLDQKREDRVIQTRKDLGAKLGLDEDFVVSLMLLIMKFSKRTQREFICNQDHDSDEKSEGVNSQRYKQIQHECRF